MPFNQPAKWRPAGRRLMNTRPVLAYLGILAGIFLFAGAVVTAAFASPGAQSGGEGEAIFQEKCAGCHTIGGGNLVGPDLEGVAERRDTQWLKDFINDPAKMIGSDVVAKKLFDEYNGMTMPAMGLSPVELEAVLAFLNDPSAAAPAPAVALPGAGSAEAGRLLFTGETALANGGTPCIACHTAGGAGSLGGGALGPDLTQVVRRMGEPGLAASLRNIVFPTMIGPFAGRPLTESEQADLVAYLREADHSQPPVQNASAGALTGNTLVVFSVGAVGAGLLFAMLFFFWTGQKRKMTVRLPARKL